jgi:hypothetical protein
MPKRLITSIIVIFLFTTTTFAATLPGSFQWIVNVYFSLPSAASGLAAGAADPLPPILIQTSDPTVPFAVFRWEFVDLTLAPPSLVYFIGNENAAVKRYKEWRWITSRKAGIVTTGNPKIAVAWMTR